jgi:hypothetical protein
MLSSGSPSRTFFWSCRRDRDLTIYNLATVVDRLESIDRIH